MEGRQSDNELARVRAEAFQEQLVVATEALQRAEAAEKIIREMVLWINTNAKHLPEDKRRGILDYIKRKGIQGPILRVIS